ncbi:MAG: Crp/Fnr family transcriptional regulator [Bacteroidales bacterium]|nr:Crp/Fnr family transcriptional regulator [Bacteroidales bacterium]
MKFECINCICKSKATETLGHCDVDKLTDNKALVTFTKGENIIRQGTFSTNIAFLRSGIAKIHLTGPSHEQIVRIIKAPTYMGLPTTFGEKINQYSVTAIGDVEVCYIDITFFRKLLNEKADFSYEIILELCRNELETLRRCANRTQKQLRGNLADVLLDLSENIFESESFILPMNQSELAGLVDTSRESISRLLTEFSKDGIIEMSGKQIKITNEKSLKLISQNG